MKTTRLVLPLIAAAGIVFWLVSASAEDAATPHAPLSKGDVENIVRDYIKEHPLEILNSVDEYQRSKVSERHKEGLAQNQFALFKEKSPETGNPKGDVTIVEFFDYNCGYCKRVLPTVQQLMDEDKNLRVIFKDFPILGPSSELAAKWSLAADMQGKYFEFHKALLAAHGAINEEMLSNLAKDAGLDVEKLKKDAQDSSVSDKISKNRQLATSMGLTGTPAFVIGDQVAPGALPLDQFKEIIATERAGKNKEDGKTPEPEKK